MLVETRGLRKAYGEQVALDGVDLAVPEGSVYGLVGPNGSGKTTMLSVLAGLRRPTGGEVRVQVARQRIAVLPDTPRFDEWLTAREVVDLARGLVAADLPGERVDLVLQQAGLGEDADRRVGGFSRGMLQRLGIACTLVGDPALVLLDEPASALDPAGRREILDLIARMRGQVTVLFSSHILADVQQVCDTVGILRAGRLLFQGPLQNLLVGRAAPAYRVHLRAGMEQTAAALTAAQWVRAVDTVGPQELRVSVASMEQAETGLPQILAAAGARVISLGPETGDLEQIFLELTS